MLEKTLESPLDYKGIKPVHPKGNQSWIFIGRTDVEAETPILWPPDAKSWLIWKDLDAGKDWRQEEKGMTEDEMVGWHHWLNRHEFEQALGDGEREGSLACCSPWGSQWVRHESDWTTKPRCGWILVHLWSASIKTPVGWNLKISHYYCLRKVLCTCSAVQEFISVHLTGRA